MRDRFIVEVSGQQIPEYLDKIMVQLICECDLYARIYGMYCHGHIGHYRISLNKCAGTEAENEPLALSDFNESRSMDYLFS